MRKFNKIFICGLSRTGTKSLSQYLRELNLNVVHNGGRVYDPAFIKDIDVLSDDKQTQFLYEVLNELYPNSLFIYTNREHNSWVDKIISWKTSNSYIFHQCFGIEVNTLPDTRSMLTSFKIQHFNRFQIFSNNLEPNQVLYLNLEDEEKDKKILDFLEVKYNKGIEYPNIKYGHK